MPIKQTIQKWHTFVETGNHKILDDILAQKVIFHSPVLHAQQKGKALTKMYLGAAYLIFKETGFTYKKQILQENQAVVA
ncbi:MAG: hypothetical protein L3J53_02895 [Proteobacteria bacterium]|nr:hypothetical protein [Pseudomonadota bacterium]